MTTYKIVDSFNGCEDNRRFDDLDSAMKQLEIDTAEFHSQLTNTNSYCCKDVVTADLEWSFDYQQNKFCWM